LRLLLNETPVILARGPPVPATQSSFLTMLHGMTPLHLFVSGLDNVYRCSSGVSVRVLLAVELTSREVFLAANGLTIGASPPWLSF